AVIEKCGLASSAMINPKIRRHQRWTEEAKRVACWIFHSLQQLVSVLGKRELPASKFHMTKERQAVILLSF
ncbi:hypothetical protein, partial [Candidatus Methylacidiphilum fumarolicum]|uniref:hypothetical protein n=1 Tax=Candidatus Methylacidiphilum fumarolicum TaxID=591154 RepID=UPI001ABCBCA3